MCKEFIVMRHNAGHSTVYVANGQISSIISPISNIISEIFAVMYFISFKFCSIDKLSYDHLPVMIGAIIF